MPNRPGCHCISGSFLPCFQCMEVCNNLDEIIESLQSFIKTSPSFMFFHFSMNERWVGSSHSDFVIEHPSETELPWQDESLRNYREINKINSMNGEGSKF